MAHRTIPLMIVLLLVIAGCGNDGGKIADLATREAERQSRQNEQLLELEKTVAQGAQELVTADAASRKEMASLHRDLQTERSEIGRQRDHLEAERRVIASQRRTDPLYTSAFNLLAAFAVAVGPLILCAVLLRRATEPVDSTALTEVLIEDAIRKVPMLRLPSSDPPPLLDRPEPTMLPGEHDH